MYKKIGVFICALSICGSVFSSFVKMTSAEEKRKEEQEKIARSTGFTIPLFMFIDDTEMQASLASTSFQVGRNAATSAELSHALTQKVDGIIIASASLFVHILTRAQWFEACAASQCKDEAVVNAKYLELLYQLKEYKRQEQKGVSKQAIQDRALRELHAILGTPDFTNDFINKIKGGNASDYLNLFYYETFYHSTFSDTSVFDFDAWEIREVNEHLIVLIRKQYLTDVMHCKPSATVRASYAPLSSCELKLGIRLEHMKLVSQETVNTLYGNYKMNPAAVPTDRSYFTTAMLEHIFVPHNEYAQISEKAPAYVVYGSGHGGYGDVIMELSTGQFTQILDILQDTVYTKLFVMNSCYSGGQALERIQKALGAVHKEGYQYPIILGASSDVVTHLQFKTIDFENLKKQFIDWDRLFFKIYSINRDFTTIVRQAQAQKLDFKAIGEAIFKGEGNVPQIIEPATMKARSLFPEQNFEIDESFVRQQAGRNFSFSRGATAALKTVVFSAPIVPFNVSFEFDKGDTPLFLVGTEKQYFIKKLSNVGTMGVEEFLGLFARSLKEKVYRGSHVLYIQEVNDRLSHVLIILNRSIESDREQTGLCSIYGQDSYGVLWSVSCAAPWSMTLEADNHIITSYNTLKNSVEKSMGIRLQEDTKKQKKYEQEKAAEGKKRVDVDLLPALTKFNAQLNELARIAS